MKTFEIIGSSDLNRLENWIRFNRMNFIENRCKEKSTYFCHEFTIFHFVSMKIHLNCIHLFSDKFLH